MPTMPESYRMGVGLLERLTPGAGETDPFREVPIRYLGYANEVGESFRHVVAVRWVHLSYFISSGYVAAHALQQGYRASGRQGHHLSSHAHVHKTNPSAAVLDTLIWQGLASVVIPGFTINRICALSRCLLRQPVSQKLLSSPVLRKWAVTVVGLGSIPFIIEPIDRFVDRCMDLSSRPFLKRFFS